MPHSTQCALPDDVLLHPLQRHDDQRGWLMEGYRGTWFEGLPIARQWNITHSGVNTMRALHVHGIHHDYLTLITGELFLGLQDVRPWSASHGRACGLTLRAEEPVIVSIPPGVAHGFWFPHQPAMYLVGVSHYWAAEDELGCRWDDPDVRVSWPGAQNPILSESDQQAGSYRRMQQDLLDLMGVKA